MRRSLFVLALGMLLLTLSVTPGAPALPREEYVIYLETNGHFHVGLKAIGVGDAGAGTGPVNLATYRADVDDCRRSLRLSLDFNPQNVSADSPAASVALPNELQVRLFNATSGKALPGGTITWRAPGTMGYALDAATPLRIQLFLLQGVDVDYRLRVSGWVHPDAECTWRGSVFLNEFEPNPSGIDAGNEWVEVLNDGFSTLDLSGWSIRSTHGRTEEHLFPEGTSLAMGERMVVTFPHQFIDNDDEALVLVGARGWEIDRTPTLSDRENDGRTWQRVPDRSDDWAFRTGTPGASNG